MPKPETLRQVEVKPDPDLEKRTRRVFTTEYKLSVIQRADACEHGELGALLRKEKLYSSQLTQWRREFAEQGVEGLKKSVPGPKPGKTTDQRRIEQLEKENQRLKKQLEIKDNCIALQKKVLTLIEQAEQESLQ